FFCSMYCLVHISLRAPPSSPTRRSSDLIDLKGGVELGMGKSLFTRYAVTPAEAVVVLEDAVEAMSARLERMAGNTRQHTASTDEDRKSTRLNSSHVSISYAVFCLKKKNI